MIKDNGPKHNLGFGVPLQEEPEQGHTGAGSNAIQKALNGHPVMRFFAVAGSAAISMHLAGQVVRHGGIRLAGKAQDLIASGGTGAEAAQNAIHTFRRIESHLDSLQGVERSRQYLEDPDSVVRRVGEKWVREKPTTIDGFLFRSSQLDRDPELVQWGMRDALQQKLISSARRLPYEAPGFYAAQKAVLEPLTGESENPKNKVNWSSPIDVIGDFSYQTMKNLSLNILPFEIGGTAGKQAYRSFAMQATQQPGNHLGFLTTRTMLEQLGVDATNLMDKTIKHSNSSLGAFSEMMRESSAKGKTFGDFVRTQKNAAFTNEIEYKNAGFARRLFLQAKDITNNKDHISRRTTLDTLPGPFKGMGSGIAKFRETRKELNQVHDDWQDMIRGRKSLNQLRKISPARHQSLLNYMEKGGGTSLEQFGKASFELGKGGPVLPDGKPNPDWMSGSFFQSRSTDIYKGILADELSKSTGLKPEHAAQFVKQADMISPFPGGKAPRPGGENLVNRFKYTSDSFHGDLGKSYKDNVNDWWQNLTRGASKHGIPMDKDGMSLDLFRQAVRNTDMHYNSPGFRAVMKTDIEDQWKSIYQNVLPKYASQSINTTRKSYELFQGAGLEANRDFLVRKTAQRLGVDTVDATGNALPKHLLKQGIWDAGLNPDDLHRLRGFLVTNKEISNPWNVQGKNVFGFRPLTVAEGMNNDFYSHNAPGVKKEIQHYVNQRTYGAAVGRGGNLNPTMQANTWDLKIDRVYVGPNGKVMDFGRVGRNITAAIDRFSNEFQVPLIHLKPLQMMGRSSAQATRNTPSIVYASGRSTQPVAMVGGKGFKQPDYYLWMKSSAKKSKGHVVGITGKSVNEYKGLFKPGSTNVQNMVGRYGHIMTGKLNVPSSQQHEKNWQRKLDVNFNQENNLFAGRKSATARWWQTLTRKPESRKNPYRFAERIAQDGFNPKAITTAESEGMENLVSTLRSYGFSQRTLKEISNDPAFKHLFSLEDSMGNKALDIPDNLLPRFIEEALRKDRSLLEGTTEAVRIKKLQQNLLNLMRQGKEQNDFWNLPAHRSIKASGISTRIDQLKSELYDYLAIRGDTIESIAKGKTPTEFNDTITNLINKLESLHKNGSISAAERAEGRAAILSLQVDNARNMTHAIGVDQFAIQHNAATLEALLSGGVKVKELMAEVGSFNPVHHGQRGLIKRNAAKVFASTDYETPYQINPTGTNTMFMPTFKTAFDNNPTQAILGVLGASRKPDAISGGAIASHHLVERINHYFGTIGLTLDPTRYSSPLSEFAVGIIGKRVLPIYAAGTTALAIDRTAGGLVKEDDAGNPVYSPLLLGAAANVFASGQVALAAAIPGGQTGEEKRRELDEGEVPIRAGRFWAMGNTPFKGGRIQSFRPSWLQRLEAGASYAPEMNETPLERLAFGYDFSPLRPLDPYRRERQDFQSRPYPLTGDYFTGPWGPLTPALNATVGRILKPRQRMHEEETKYGLQQYMPVGDGGAYFSPTPTISAGRTSEINDHYIAAIGGVQSSTTPFYGSQGYSQPRGVASMEVRNRTSAMAQLHSDAASRPGSYVSTWDALVPYGVPVGQGLSPRVVAGQEPLDYGSTNVMARRLAFNIQEMTGIYGFAAASTREALGFGNKDLAPRQAILEPASRGYSAGRAFWNLNLGGAGDLPLPIEGQFANLEISEIVRRFVPREPAGTTYINNIPNLMGKMYPWLPGADYPLANLKAGDPYNAITDSEIRLPGTGYARTHTLYSDQYGGKLGLANIHDILGDVAPWSNEFKAIDSAVDSTDLSAPARNKIQQTRAQVEAMRFENEFTPYVHRYDSVLATATSPSSAVGKAFEWIAHRDSYLGTKLGAPRTALEDWERDNVYGSTFPKWETPYQSFIRPSIDKSTQRDPISAMFGGGAIGYLFGATAKAQKIGSVIGGAIGIGASLYGKAYEQITGDRFIPLERRKQLALEENVDILAYTRAVRGASVAQQSGDFETAKYFTQQIGRTMYGVDLNSTPEQIAMAVPSRKREHFRAMLYAPQEEREQILSTAGRLERRLFQAAWGMPVEEKPDLVQYFQDHELPPPDAEIWSPNMNMDNIKIKMGQSIGLDMAQMGYYPQQITEANLINPSYPSMLKESSSYSVRAQLKRLMLNIQATNGTRGDIVAMPSSYPGNRVELTAGVF